MSLDGILERNREFVRGREPQPLPAADESPLAVVACSDPRLDRVLLQALGIDPGSTMVLRVAGAAVRAGGDPLRSLALGAFLFGVREVLVVGHTSCRMASFSNASFIDAFRAHGVPREAFGLGDLREWAGAIADPAQGVRSSVDAIAAAPYLPAGLLIAGLVLDDSSGALSVVVPEAALGARGGLSEGSAAQPALPREPEHDAAVPEEPPSTGRASPAPVEGSAAGKVEGEVDALVGLLEAAEGTAGLREDLGRLRKDLSREPTVAGRIKMVESFVRKASSASRELAGAYEALRRKTFADGKRIRVEDLIDVFRRRGRSGP